MDLSRALWAIFNLESAVLRDLMRVLNEFHKAGLSAWKIERVKWTGDWGVQEVYEEKICKNDAPRLNFDDLPVHPERLELYWNIRHQWVHRHGIIDAEFKGAQRCETLFEDGWFQFGDDLAWLEEDHMHEILADTKEVGRWGLKKAIEEYPSIEAELG